MGGAALLPRANLIPIAAQPETWVSTATPCEALVGCKAFSASSATAVVAAVIPVTLGLATTLFETDFSRSTASALTWNGTAQSINALAASVADPAVAATTIVATVLAVAGGGATVLAVADLPGWTAGPVARVFATESIEALAARSAFATTSATAIVSATLHPIITDGYADAFATFAREALWADNVATF